QVVVALDLEREQGEADRRCSAHEGSDAARSYPSVQEVEEERGEGRDDDPPVLSRVDRRRDDPGELEGEPGDERDRGAAPELPRQQVHPQARDPELRHEDEGQDPGNREQKIGDQANRIEGAPRIGEQGNAAVHVGHPLRQLPRCEAIRDELVEEVAAREVVRAEDVAPRQEGRQKVEQGQAEEESGGHSDPDLTRSIGRCGGPARRCSSGRRLHRPTPLFSSDMRSWIVSRKFRCSSAMWSQRKRLADARALWLRRLRAAPSRSSSSAARARAIGSPTGTRTPPCGGSTTSGSEPVFDAITGTPAAMASAATMPKPSNLDGISRILAPENSSARVSSS